MSWQRAAMAMAARGAQSTPTWVKIGIGATVVGVPLYFLMRSGQKNKWEERLGETDVQVAAYFVGLVGPPTVWEKLKKMFSPIEWGKAIGNDVLDFFTGSTLKAIKAGIDRALDWTLVMEAYKGLCNSNLWADIGEKLKAEELKEIQKYHAARFERRQEHIVSTEDRRSRIIAQFYDGGQKWTKGKVYKLGPQGEGFKTARIMAYKDVAGLGDNFKVKSRGAGRKAWLKGEFIGTMTNRVRKTPQDGKIQLELRTGSGLFWFPIETLDIYR